MGQQDGCGTHGDPTPKSCRSSSRSLSPWGPDPAHLCAGEHPGKPPALLNPCASMRTAMLGKKCSQQLRHKVLNIFCLSAKSLQYGSLSFFLHQTFTREGKPETPRASQRSLKPRFIQRASWPLGSDLSKQPVCTGHSIACTGHGIACRYPGVRSRKPGAGREVSTPGLPGGSPGKGASLPSPCHFLPCSL